MEFMTGLWYTCVAIVLLCFILSVVFVITDRLKGIKSVPQRVEGNPYDKFLPTEFINHTVRKK